jgi:hypothetical protein
METEFSTGNKPLAKARVFISCGQRSDKEKQLGFACRDYFENRGFSTYLAEEVQSLEALTENIFHHLRNTEYAVFIDCAREKLSPGEFRGSVFINQELAIAAFLPIEESRVFHEGGVIREGVVEYLIAKPIQFSSEREFLEKLKEETKEWESGWRNDLSLEFLRMVPNVRDQYGNYEDWYHLQVKNNHRDKYARNCVAYVSKIKNLDTGEEGVPGNFELVWAGTGLFERHILPKASAEVDAFFIVRGQDVIRFHHRPSTSSQYGMPVLHKGSYLLTYLVVSENFEQVTKTFKLEFAGDFTGMSFYVHDE